MSRALIGPWYDDGSGCLSLGSVLASTAYVETRGMTKDLCAGELIQCTDLKQDSLGS